MTTVQTTTAPELLIIAYRPSKGCKQYVFRSYEEFAAWCARKPYCNERIGAIVAVDRREVARLDCMAGSAATEVRHAAEHAVAALKTAKSLANQLLIQVAGESSDAAYWMISALSKLVDVQPSMTAAKFLEFASAAMPEAAEEYRAYANKTNGIFDAEAA